MTERQKSTSCCANFLARSFFLSFEEELGADDMKEVLRSVGLDTYGGNYPPNTVAREVPLQDIGTFFHALENFFDDRSCRGLIQRAGRNCFNRLHRLPEPALGLSTIDFLVLPKAMKLRHGAQIIADYFQKYADLVVRTSWEGQELRWQVEYQPTNGTQSWIKYLADFFLGFWQEALYFISGGKSFSFNHDIANQKGQAHCLIRIPSVPID